MSKQVYSIVLDDEIIKEIDRCAMQNNTSRSNMINRILAEYVNLPTAETIINEIFSSINSFMQTNDSLAVQLLGNGSLINVKSALKYRYNPSVKYTVEIYENSDYLGNIRITMRSQNETLISILNHFFAVWGYIENKYAGVDEKEYEFSNGKYIRLLRFPTVRGNENIGNIIASYVEILDGCMKVFFGDYSRSPALAEQNTEKAYLKYMTKNIAKL